MGNSAINGHVQSLCYSKTFKLHLSKPYLACQPLLRNDPIGPTHLCTKHYQCYDQAANSVPTSSARRQMTNVGGRGDGRGVVGDSDNQRTGNPELNPPGFNGMIEGFFEHCSDITQMLHGAAIFTWLAGFWAVGKKKCKYSTHAASGGWLLQFANWNATKTLGSWSIIEVSFGKTASIAMWPWNRRWIRRTQGVTDLGTMFSSGCLAPGWCFFFFPRGFYYLCILFYVGIV